MPSVVYFIQRDGGDIKIGFTTDLAKRFFSLSESYKGPLAVLAVLRGNRDTEKELHERFSAFRIAGEWFSPARPLLQFIRETQASSTPVPLEAPRAALSYAERSAASITEAQQLLRRLVDGSISAAEQVETAGRHAGLDKSRAIDLWYGKARRIDAFEMDAIRAAVREYEGSYEADVAELQEITARAAELLDRIERRQEMDRERQ